MNADLNRFYVGGNPDEPGPNNTSLDEGKAEAVDDPAVGEGVKDAENNEGDKVGKGVVDAKSVENNEGDNAVVSEANSEANSDDEEVDSSLV